MGTKGGRKINKDERRQIYEKFDGHCAYCGREITYGEMQVDHVIPLREGGIDEVENMFPVCSVCNRYKKGNGIETFRRGISTIPKKLERDVFTYRVGIIYGFLPIKRQNVVFYFEKVESDEFKNVYKMKVDEHVFWIAESKDLNGCVGQGETAEEALSELEINEEEWLDAAREYGIPIPDPSVKTMSEYGGKFMVKKNDR